MTTTFTVSVPADVFKAVAMFRADKDVRYYLRGLCLELSRKGAFLVGTNGHALSVARIDTNSFPDYSVIIRSELVAQLEKIKNGQIVIELPTAIGRFDGATPRAFKVVAHATAGRASSSATTSMEYTTTELDGQFPDWRRVLKHVGTPTDINAAINEPPIYQAAYHKLVDDAGRLLKGTKKDSPAAIIKPGYEHTCGYAQLDHAGEVGAWVMPVRRKAEDMAPPPAWSFTF
jgi:hypothetical protein